MNSIMNIEWINTLSAKQINDIIVEIALEGDEDKLKQFITVLKDTTVTAESPSDEQWLSLYKNAYSLWKKIILRKELSSKDEVENEKEDILYCLQSSINGSEKMPEEIIIDLLNKVDLDLKTSDYSRNPLDLACSTGNIFYIEIILKRAVNEKSRTKLFEFIQDKFYGNYDIKFVKKLEQIFKDLDLPFSEAVHGKYFNHDILGRCDKSVVLELCIDYLPNRCIKYILEKRGFDILSNFITKNTEDLIKAVELFEKFKVNLNEILNKRCEKRMSLLDKACLQGNHKNISYILSKMDDESKIKALSYSNYGFRTPLDHAIYYQYYGDAKEKERIIIEEMKKLGLIKEETPKEDIPKDVPKEEMLKKISKEEVPKQNSKKKIFLRFFKK